MSVEWKKVLVSPNISIREALSVIDTQAVRIAIVVNSSMELLGTVTDGDIRRGLLKEISLEDEVNQVMNSSSHYCDFSTPRKVLMQRMNEWDILAIPLCENGKVVGLSTLHDELTHPKKYNNPVFIMAGGFGTRLKPLTDNCPKPLLKVGDKPILETVLKRFIQAGFHDFYISTHFLPQMIRDYFGAGEKWGVSITYVHEEKPLGTGGALGLLPKSIPDLPVLVMNGDILSKIDFEAVLDSHYKNNADATMCVREYEYQVPFGVVEGDGNKIKHMVEKPTHHFYVNAGIYVIGQWILKSIKLNERIDMPTLLERHLGDNVLMHPFHDYWLDIGRKDDFDRAQSDILSVFGDD